jgi:hypothetical protein
VQTGSRVKGRPKAFNDEVAILPWWLDGNITSFRTFH